MVEDEPRSVAAAEPPGDGPEDVGRVAGLQDVELALATSPEHQPRGCEEGVRVFQDEAECPAPRRIGAIFQQRHALEDLSLWVALSLGAHDRDVISRRGQGLGLQPDATVEGDRQVLDDDQNPWACIRLARAGQTAHPIPS